MITLEEIYQNYFDCPVPFAKSGRLTKSGAIAHEKLIQLIKDLEDLGVYADGRLSICLLDEISNEGISYKQEMCNELMRFITSCTEEYVLEKPVRIDLDGRTYNLKYFSQDTDYHDIFMAEEKWKVDEDNNFDLFDFTALSEDEAKRVFEAILCQEIGNGWEWKEHAREVLKKKYPDDELDEAIDTFVCENWQNLCTDAWNVENFEDSL